MTTGDCRVNLRVKGKVYKTVVRPAMMYGAKMYFIMILYSAMSNDAVGMAL